MPTERVYLNLFLGVQIFLRIIDMDTTTHLFLSVFITMLIFCAKPVDWQVSSNIPIIYL